MKHLPFLLSLPLLTFWLSACNDQQQTKESTAADSTIVKADTVPLKRATIEKKAVADYTEKVTDELNDWKFAVQLYETAQTFHYTVRMQYKELRVTDAIILPNLGTMPKPRIRADTTGNAYSCIIGFLDNKGSFKPYYRASVKDNRLQFKKIAGYAVSISNLPKK